MGETVSNVANPRIMLFSLSANNAHNFVCTVIRTVDFSEGIDSFKLRNQEGNKSVNHAED